MLFLPESVCESRLSLLEDVEHGRLTEEQTSLRALELDPADYIALTNLGRAR